MLGTSRSPLSSGGRSPLYGAPCLGSATVSQKRGTVSRYTGDVGSTHGAAAALGRPRSEVARRAVLHAVDDLLVDVGYAAMTMKGIAERAGVGRQTVYRWWSNKAEILLEACVADARSE